MVVQQLSFGGVRRVSFCSRCKKPLSNPASVEAGMGPICRGHRGEDLMNGDIAKREEFSDGEIDNHISLNVALVLARRPRLVMQDDNPAEVGQCLTNVPHLVVRHSPDGFEFGYGGSGPADLALNICQYYLNSIGYEGERTQCYDGNCFSLAWVLHQEFKREFIASAPREGITIPMVEIKAWFEAHITEDMKQMYAVIVEEEFE